MLYLFLKHAVIGPLVLGAFRPWMRGLENVPKSGPVLFVSNHLSFIDSVFLPLAIDRPIHFLAKSEYFTGTGLKGWFTRVFFRAIGQLPIDRSGGRASEASLESGLAVLAAGGQLGIYPEGTRSPDGRLYRGRTGAARMALEAHVPVIPVAMIDTDKVMPSGTIVPKVRRVGLVFGEPLDFSRFAGLEGDRFVLRSITDEMMYELSRLGGQEYVDVYASSVKKAEPSARVVRARSRAAEKLRAEATARAKAAKTA
ncbi:MAG: 1-acyl-sn-glycerol-3-phosphate acyltransferase [Micrococcales bacterium]|nr:1-acyl-sn-glycerol-3-phosphate acyltransferase [Micrococcales bacterium]